MLSGPIEFVALLFLPGMAFMEVFRLGGHSSLAERLALALGLSMSILVIALLASTSGGSLAGARLLGVQPLLLHVILAVSVVVVAVPALMRRRFFFYVRPERYDVLALALVAVMAALVAVHFAKYPVFPQFSSIDFEQSTRITSDLQSGHIASLPGGVLYYGMQLLMASFLALSGDIPLEATQYTAGLLAALSPLLVYSATKAVTRSANASVIALLIFIGSGSLWFGMVFNSGLYPNFYGVLSMLLLVSFIPLVLEEPGRLVVWVGYLLVLSNLLFSHYSAITVLPAILLVPVVSFALSRKPDKPLLAVGVLPFIPVVLALALDPGLLTFLSSLSTVAGGQSVQGDTAVSQYLAGFPFLRFLFVVVSNDLASVVMLALGALGVYLACRGRHGLILLPVLWFAALLVATPQNGLAWRFSLVSLMPLTILAAMAVEKVIPVSGPKQVKKRLKWKESSSRSWRLLLVFLLLLSLTAGSWSYNATADAAAGTSQANQEQYYVLQTMMWVKNNTAPGTGVLSPTDWHFAYTELVIQRDGVFAALLPPALAVNNSAKEGYGLVALTQYLVLPGSSGNSTAGLALFSQYSSSPSFREVYSNPGVELFEIASGAAK